jgi:hypothetical protein
MSNRFRRRSNSPGARNGSGSAGLPWIELRCFARLRTFSPSLRARASKTREAPSQQPLQAIPAVRAPVPGIEQCGLSSLSARREDSGVRLRETISLRAVRDGSPGEKVVTFRYWLTRTETREISAPPIRMFSPSASKTRENAIPAGSLLLQHGGFLGAVVRQRLITCANVCLRPAPRVCKSWHGEGRW